MKWLTTTTKIRIQIIKRKKVVASKTFTIPPRQLNPEFDSTYEQSIKRFIPNILINHFIGQYWY